MVIGGNWTESFLNLLVNTVQVDNPRIVDIRIERVNRSIYFVESLVNSVQKLLLDYFNYSIPGIRTLSLHGCSIKDFHIELLCSGLEVNFSINSICLSLNLITDAGFIILFTSSLLTNKKNKITKIDLNWNLIQCGRKVQDLLTNFQCHNTNNIPEISFIGNPFKEQFQPEVKFYEFRPAQIRLIYAITLDDKLSKPHHEKKIRRTNPLIKFDKDYTNVKKINKTLI
jgi:hypothetical protein